MKCFFQSLLSYITLVLSKAVGCSAKQLVHTGDFSPFGVRAVFVLASPFFISSTSFFFRNRWASRLPYVTAPPYIVLEVLTFFFIGKEPGPQLYLFFLIGLRTLSQFRLLFPNHITMRAMCSLFRPHYRSVHSFPTAKNAAQVHYG